MKYIYVITTELVYSGDLFVILGLFGIECSFNFGVIYKRILYALNHIGLLK